MKSYHTALKTEIKHLSLACTDHPYSPSLIRFIAFYVPPHILHHRNNELVTHLQKLSVSLQLLLLLVPLSGLSFPTSGLPSAKAEQTR